MKANKDNLIEHVVSLSKKDGAKSIKADIKGYKKPGKYSYKGHTKGFYPDVVANYGKHSDVFSVEPKLRKSDLPEVIGKWILLSMEARRLKGEYYIVVPHKEKGDFEEIVESKMIRAEVLPVK